MGTVIKVKYVEQVLKKDNEESKDIKPVDKEILVNINCPIKLILDYIRKIAGLDKTCDIDLYDYSTCQSKNVSLVDPYTSGLDVLQPDLTYLITIRDRNNSGQSVKTVSGKATKKHIEVQSKVRKSTKKNISNVPQHR